MNIQSGQARVTRPAGHVVPGSLLPKMWFVTKVVLFLVAAAALFNGHIYLRQKIAETERGIRRTERRITDTRRELEQLRADYAEYTRWPHIRRQIAAFKLPLESPRPGQVRPIRIYTPQQIAKIAGTFDPDGAVRFAAR